MKRGITAVTPKPPPTPKAATSPEVPPPTPIVTTFTTDIDTSPRDSTAKRKRTFGDSPDIEATRRPRLTTIHESPTRPETLSPGPAPQPRRRARSEGDLDVLIDLAYNPPPANEHAFLTKLVTYLNTEEVTTKALVQTAMSGTIAQLDEAVNIWLAAVFPVSRRRRTGAAVRRQRPPLPPPPYTASQRRTATYKKAQDMFHKDPAWLAERIVTGRPLLEEEITPTIQQVEDHFAGLYEDNNIRSSPTLNYTKEAQPVYVPVEDVELRAAASGWRNSAPGPDGITVQMVKACPTAMLEVLYNVMLYRQFTPAAFRASRTILLPKDGDRRDPKNWRPITISSAVQRLLHRVLAKRLTRGLNLHPLQRGFVDVDGLLANTATLDAYIKFRRIQGKSYNVISLDVRKAFDTVSHVAIQQALYRLGTPPAMIDYVSSTLQPSYTTISVKGNTTRQIRFLRGVKQGDPLSPILFNAVLDELVCGLNTLEQGGTLPSGDVVTAIAFADDLLLLQDNDIYVPEALDLAYRFFRDRGMELNPEKSVSISATTIQGKSVTRSRSIFRIQGAKIPTVGDLPTFKYLGLKFSTAGVEKPTIYNLVQWLSNLHKAPLKPDQKYHMLKLFIVPRLYHGFQTPAIMDKTLSEVDRLIRKAARRILHLAVHTGSQFLHASTQDGGLGLPQLRHQIPDVLLRRIENLSQADELMGRLFQAAGPAADFHQRVRRLATRGPPRPYWREQMATRPYSKGLEESAMDAASRDWLHKTPRGWSGRDFVRAIQLRTGNLPTQGLPYNPQARRWCRAGCARIESVSHILQACPTTHFERINRHNEIVGKVGAHCRQKQWTTEVEARVRHQDGQLYIPDLAIHLTDNHILVCDVQVSWEGTRTLAESWERKRLVYDHQHFLEAAKKKWPGNSISILPLILGARGIWPRCNAQTAQLLQLPKQLKSSCVHSCLKWGSTLHRQFMASVWRHGPRPPPNHQPRPPER